MNKTQEQIEEYYEELTTRKGFLELSTKASVVWMYEELNDYFPMKMDKYNYYHNSCGNNNCRYKFEMYRNDCPFMKIPEIAFSGKARLEIEEIYKNLEKAKEYQNSNHNEYLNICFSLLAKKQLIKLTNFANATQTQKKVDERLLGQIMQDGHSNFTLQEIERKEFSS